jgi:hypothetical protein
MPSFPTALWAGGLRSPLDTSSTWSRISRGACTMRDLGPAYSTVATCVFWKAHPNFENPFSVKTQTHSPDLQPDSEVLRVRQRNIEQSLFHSLPTEVLLMIARYAEGEVIVALRGTCARFQRMFPDPTAFAENILEVEKWRRDYTQRRRVHRRHELCEDERGGKSQPDELVCHPCIATHARKCFSPSAQATPPETRACIGWSSKLRLCAHKSIELSSLAWYKPGAWCGKQHAGIKSHLSSYLTVYTILELTRNDCSSPCGCPRHPHETLDAGGGRGVRLGVVGKGIDDEGRPATYPNDALEGLGSSRHDREVVVRAEIVLARIPQDEVMSTTKLLELLLATAHEKDGEGLCMCPHLTLATISLQLLSRPYADCSNLASHTRDTTVCTATPRHGRFTLLHIPIGSGHQTSQLDMDACGKRYRCAQSGCDTFFYFHRARFSDFSNGCLDELILCVVRRLGACRDAHDPKWLVQLARQQG